MERRERTVVVLMKEGSASVMVALCGYVRCGGAVVVRGR